MFKTIVLACLFMSPDVCLEFHDTRGPYQTYDMCRARAYEISNAIREIHPEYVPARFRCDQLKGQAL